MSCPGLFYEKALYHLVINISWQMTKKKDPITNLSNFGENVKNFNQLSGNINLTTREIFQYFNSNLFEKKYQVPTFRYKRYF